jgi:hypothetical protein
LLLAFIVCNTQNGPKRKEELLYVLHSLDWLCVLAKIEKGSFLFCGQRFINIKAQ